MGWYLTPLVEFLSKKSFDVVHCAECFTHGHFGFTISFSLSDVNIHNSNLNSVSLKFVAEVKVK